MGGLLLCSVIGMGHGGFMGLIVEGRLERWL